MVDTVVNSPTNTVPYHQQDTAHWCGSACALMVLHYLGVGRAGGFPLDQKRVRMVAQHSARFDPTYQWVSAPDGLTAALNYFCERSDVAVAGKEGAERRWELVAADSEEELSRYIVWTLWRYRTPAIALVFGMQHWVVVGGCVTSRPPAGPNDTGYEIIGFHLSDPWPPIPRELARNDRFKHMDRRDHTGGFVVIDGCGSGWEGDPGNDAVGGRGVALRFVAYNDWRVRDASTPERKRHTGYMTGVPPTLKLATRPGKPEITVRSRWVGKYLAICDPVATRAAVAEEVDVRWEVERWLRALPPSPEGGAEAPRGSQTGGEEALRLITPGEAILVSRAVLRAYGTWLRPGGTGEPGSGAAGAEMFEPEEPVLVEWLDEPGAYHPEAAYYLVPFSYGGARQVAVRVAARPQTRWEAGRVEAWARELLLGLNAPSTGEAEEGRGVPRRALALIDREQARARVRGRSFRWELGARLRVSEDYAARGRIVWKPCLESFDPFCPFYEFEIETSAGNAAYLYVRATDGRVFTQLTEHYGGV
jgi:hypothetical protein